MDANIQCTSDAMPLLFWVTPGTLPAPQQKNRSFLWFNKHNGILAHSTIKYQHQSVNHNARYGSSIEKKLFNWIKTNFHRSHKIQQYHTHTHTLNLHKRSTRTNKFHTKLFTKRIIDARSYSNFSLKTKSKCLPLCPSILQQIKFTSTRNLP